MKKLWRWLTFPHQLHRERCEAVAKAQFLKRAYATTHASLMSREAELRALRAQLVQVRVSQSRIGRAGWEVMSFIPEETLKVARKDTRLTELIREITLNLVSYALAGINRVDSQGRVCALVFEPLDMNQPARAPKYVQALFDDEGKFKLSEKCWDTRTEEQRLMA